MEELTKKIDGPTDSDHKTLAEMKVLEERMSKQVVMVRTKRGYIKTNCPERWKAYME
jgi:hypothetical protein